MLCCPLWMTNRSFEGGEGKGVILVSTYLLTDSICATFYTQIISLNKYYLEIGHRLLYKYNTVYFSINIF